MQRATFTEFVRHFWSLVHRRQAHECWEWRGTRNAKGYGVVIFNGKRLAAHRVAYVLTSCSRDYIAVRQNCNNTLCCNPKHLTT